MFFSQEGKQIMFFISRGTEYISLLKTIKNYAVTGFKLKDCGTCVMDLENIIVQEVG
jgi:hypothetical protein